MRYVNGSKSKPVATAKDHVSRSRRAMNIEHDVGNMAREAREASRLIAIASTAQKNQTLGVLASSIEQNTAEILRANAMDVEGAKKAGTAHPLIDRLKLDDSAVAKMCEGVRAVAALPDPIGAVTDLDYRPSGIKVGRMRIPLGVIGMIYESRPNVTIEVASLCIKSGNACLLRGGSESIETNLVLADCVTHALAKSGLPSVVVQLIRTTDRAAVGALLQQDDFVDLIVPRGGKGLIERVIEESDIPVLKHLDGICHVYVEESASRDMAIEIAFNSKAEKFAVCNAAETLLLDEVPASDILNELVDRYSEANVEIRGCERSRAIDDRIQPATQEDWETEYLGPTLAVKVVDGIEEAIRHIESFGSHHTDTIVSNDYGKVDQFVSSVDSATVMVNASTQFADGFEFGLGAEIGISTDKLHARGPVGLMGLTTEKFIVYGNGEIRKR